MPEPITIGLNSNAAAVAQRMGAFPDAALRAVAQSIDYGNQVVIADMSARKLSRRGPKTLGVVSNRLRGSMRASAAVVIGTTVHAEIGTNVVYAGVHEFGFVGVVRVREHTRRRFGYGGDGRATSKRMDASGRIRTVRRKPTSTGTIVVHAHSMQMNVRERAPIRSTIQENAENYRLGASNAVLAAWQGGAL